MGSTSWRVIPDAATAAAALQNGEVDIWEQPAFDLVPLLMKNRSIRVQRALSLSIQAFLRANALYPPFDNPKARLALAYIVNQADVMTAGYGDEKFWRRCNSYYVCGGPYGTEAGTEDLKPDLAKARALLAEAGYHGETLVQRFLGTTPIGSFRPRPGDPRRQPNNMSSFMESVY